MINQNRTYKKCGRHLCQAAFSSDDVYLNVIHTGLPVGMIFKVGISCPVTGSKLNSMMVSLSSFATWHLPFGAKQKKRGVFPRHG